VTPAQERIAARMSEKELQGTVESIALDLDLLHYHVFDSRRSREGFPDSVIVGPHGVLFRELKKQTGKVSAAQQKWNAGLAAAGQDVGVWRPADLLEHRVRVEMLAISAYRDRVAK
jgi:hypothetical protein